MGTLKEYAKQYESAKTTKNISELEEVPVDLNLEDDEFEVEKDGETKTVKQKVIQLNDEVYRVPNSVIEQLRVHIENNPNLVKFKVSKKGTGFDTRYTVIPL